MQATIKQVFTEPRLWNKPEYPDSCSVQGIFEDGSRFQLATKTGKAPEHIAALQALVGKPGEFDCQAQDFKGEREWRMKSYPGKPEKQFGGGGRQYTPAWNQTQEGAKYHELKTDRRTAIMQAISHAQPEDTVETVLTRASKIYKWLRGSEDKTETT